MKSAAISRFVVVAAIAALVVMGGSTAAWAQCPASPNYPTGFSSNGTCLTPNSNAGIVGPVLRLTNAAGNQVGSAWYNTAQPVEGGFSTSFQFQFTNASTPPADGIAFVIQYAPTALGAIGYTGGNGGAIGYGDADGNTDPSAGQGIPNSLAIEFDTFQNDWDPGPNGNGSVSHVAIQSCGTGANTSHHTSQCGGNSGNSSNLGVPVSVANLANGAVHSVTIVYNLACPTCAPSTSSNNLHVILDNVDLYPLGVPVDLSSIGLGTGNTAYIGFTGATGGDFETQDILNWTLTLQAQSASLPAVNVLAVLPFNGGTGNKAYDYNAVLTSGGITNTTAQVLPILIDPKSCNKLVQKKFPLAQCFVYQNAGKDANGKPVDSSVLFSLTCPGSTENGTCGDVSFDFFADLGSNFTFSKAENPGFQLLMATIGPYPGWLKGSGPDQLNPCVFDSNSSTPPFVSNQISSFSVVGDPLGTTKGKSGGGGSCWVATYFTPGEAPPGVKISQPAFATYHLSTTAGTASYTCSDPKTSKQLPPASAVGPYLTAATCTQSQAPNLNNSSCSVNNVNGVITCTGTFDVSTKGLHVFTVTSKDSGGNVGASAVIYNVVKP